MMRSCATSSRLGARSIVGRLWLVLLATLPPADSLAEPKHCKHPDDDCPIVDPPQPRPKPRPTPPTRSPNYPSSMCIENAQPSVGQVDLAMFVVSFHHGDTPGPRLPNTGDIPYVEDLVQAGAELAAKWPHPENIVIVVPANPYGETLKVAPWTLLTDSPATYFIKGMNSVHPNAVFQLAQTFGMVESGLGKKNNSAVIVGANWHVDSVVAREFPDEVIHRDGEGRFFGDFVISRGNVGLHVLSLQTQWGGPERRRQLNYVIDQYGSSPTGSEPAIVAGDMNVTADGGEAEVDDLHQRSNYLTCSQNCDTPRGRHVIPGILTPANTWDESKLHIAQLHGPNRLVYIGTMVSWSVDGVAPSSSSMKLSGLTHLSTSALFAISGVPLAYTANCTR
jgi:hypothetical protein